jgi:hypothetical protein
MGVGSGQPSAAVGSRGWAQSLLMQSDANAGDIWRDICFTPSGVNAVLSVHGRRSDEPPASIQMEEVP